MFSGENDVGNLEDWPNDGGFCANDAPRDGPFPSCPSWGMGGEGDWTTWRCVVGFVARML